MEKLYVLDASGYLYSSYFAIRNMTNAKGESTNALFGFVRSVMKIKKDHNVTHIVAVFDGPNNTKGRKALYPEYKAHRQSMPEDLRYQITRAKEICSLLGIAWLDVPEVEADDTMGSIAEWGKNNDLHVYLCSGDKDLCQLVDEHVSILNANKDHKLIGAKEVEETYGIPPKLMIDYLSLVGDASDNVPGLASFGPKTAVKYLLEFGSLDALLANPQRVTEKKKREIVEQQADIALLSRKLVTIATDVPFPQDRDFFTIKPCDFEPLRAFYKDMNFKSLLKELEQEAYTKGHNEQEYKAMPGDIATKYMLVDDLESLKALIEVLSIEKCISFDLKTTDIHPMKAELVGVGFGYKPGEAWYVPFNGSLGAERVLRELKPIFENPALSFYGYNVKYNLHVLEAYGISIANICCDIVVAAYLLHSENRQNSLDALAMQFFDKEKLSIDALLGKGKSAILLREAAIDKICHYSCEDVDYTCRLKLLFEKEIADRNLAPLLYDLELPLLRVLAEMEQKGIFVDVRSLELIGFELKEQIAALKLKIFDFAGEEFNLNSPKQLGEIFQKLGIKSTKKTASGQMRTDSDVLESLSSKYPIAGLLLEYRVLEKLRSTYVESLPAEVNSKTHRIHCTFNQSVAATGRLSCQTPNLQNIPVRTAAGRKIREAFRPALEGWSFLAADYSQIELRLLAHFSEDPNLVEAFKNNQDVHAHTSSVLFDCPLSDVSKDMRQQAKAVNFGIIYGQQAFGLSQALGIDVKSASQFIDMYFERYARVKIFIEISKERARLTGKTVTLIGRERAISDILSKNIPLRSAAERLAVNTPLQGTAADMIKMAMIEISKQLKSHNLKSRMILQIHDELIFEAPDEELPQLQALVKEAMENVVELKVPLLVDIAIGNNWEQC